MQAALALRLWLRPESVFLLLLVLVVMKEIGSVITPKKILVQSVTIGVPMMHPSLLGKGV